MNFTSRKELIAFKTAYLSKSTEYDLIDIDRQQYLTPNDRRTRGKNRLNYQERSSTDNYGQSKKKKKKKTSSLPHGRN
jgi:hypothetical protein